MNSPEFHRRRQKAVVIVAMMLFQLLLFFIQIWLFVMILENSLGGRTFMAVPAAIASLVIFGLNIWMLKGINLLSKSS